MIICGIDPGLTGGLAIIGPDGVETEVMPEVGGVLDLPRLATWLRMRAPDVVFLENVHALYGASAGSTFKFGRVLGAIEGVVSALGLSYQLVSPKQWQKVMHAGVTCEDAKERSRVAVSRLFPGVDLRATARCKKVHEGMMDALLLAGYGVRVLGASMQAGSKLNSEAMRAANGILEA